MRIQPIKPIYKPQYKPSRKKVLTTKKKDGKIVLQEQITHIDVRI